MIVTANCFDDKRAISTSKLLNLIYNDNQDGMKVYESHARTKALHSEMNKFFKKLIEYRDDPNNPYIHKELEVLLDRKSAFAAFKRRYVRNNKDIYDELLVFWNNGSIPVRHYIMVDKDCNSKCKCSTWMKRTYNKVEVFLISLY